MLVGTLGELGSFCSDEGSSLGLFPSLQVLRSPFSLGSWHKVTSTSVDLRCAGVSFWFHLWNWKAYLLTV